jgi:hypothetical protein
LVEQCPFKALVQGSSPCQPTNFLIQFPSYIPMSEPFGILLGFGICAWDLPVPCLNPHRYAA